MTRIFLRDTDATGVLFFTEQLRLSVETFESFLAERGFTVGRMLRSSDYLMPIVHAESDYFAPLKVGDLVKIVLVLGRIGTSSFTLNYKIYSNDKEMGKASTIHVAVDKKTCTTIPVPQELIELLSELK
ncbi:MAG: thioesterase family protein [Chlamydiota bacterium]